MLVRGSVFDDDAVGFVVEVGVVTSQFVSEAAGESGSMAVGGDIPVCILVAEEEVADGTADEVSLLLIVDEVFCCLFQKFQSSVVQGCFFLWL